MTVPAAPAATWQATAGAATAVFARADNLGAQRRTGPVDTTPAREILELLPRLAIWPPTARMGNYWLRGASVILTRLQSLPGEGWQDRWLALESMIGSAGWAAALSAGDPRSARTRERELGLGLAGLMLCRVFLPSYDFLHNYRSGTLFERARRVWRPGLADQLDAVAAAQGVAGRQLAWAHVVLAKLALHTGKEPDQLTPDDFFEFRAWSLARAGRVLSGSHAAWDLLRGIGAFPGELSLRAATRQGQRPTAELVDRYRITCKPIRDVLIRYLDERRPALDYSSFRDLASTLADTFWADIERHHRGIGTLQLPAEIAQAWKERLLTTTKKGLHGRPRRDRLPALIRVRAFYLDIQQWALEDPTWAPWAVPSPVRKSDTEGAAKHRRAVTAQMHQRVRDRLPHLPILLETAQRHRIAQAQLLAAAQATTIGSTFDHAGTTYRRAVLKTAGHSQKYTAAPAVLIETLPPASGSTKPTPKTTHSGPGRSSKHCGTPEYGSKNSWKSPTWHWSPTNSPTPARSCRCCRSCPPKPTRNASCWSHPNWPASWPPSSPACAAAAHTSPSPPATDYQERTTGPRLPHLFPRQHGWRHEVTSPRTVQKLLNDTLTRTGLTDPAGKPLRYTPHDFRRMFATEAVTGGLPVHIAARILGHHNLTTTQAYLAVFQDDLIRSYRAFVGRRRATRPTAEYREPTSEEWREFQQHFQLRKLELGTCGRPYGTPCNHEHACIRCPMLRVDPRQRNRLTEIIENLKDRITESRMNGWLGEVQGLQTSLDAARSKLTTLNRAIERNPAQPTDLGIPTIGQAK